MAFADHADDQGICWPSIGRIAWKSGYSKRQTQAIVRLLKELGILESVGHEKGGRGTPTVYRIHTEKGAKLAPFRNLKGCGRVPKTVRPSAEKGEIPNAPESSRDVSEPSVEKSSPQGSAADQNFDASTRTSAKDDYSTTLLASLENSFPDASTERLAWAIEVVRKRAKRAGKTPGSVKYFQKSLCGIFASLDATIQDWLAEQAFQLISQASIHRSDLAEELKYLAAKNDLPYSSDFVAEAIERADQRAERDRQVRSELNVGRFVSA